MAKLEKYDFLTFFEKKLTFWSKKNDLKRIFRWQKWIFLNPFFALLEKNEKQPMKSIFRDLFAIFHEY